MNIIEQHRQTPEGNEEIKFSIIGDRKENSTEIPMWEKVITISGLEKVQKTAELLVLMKKRNAMDVFDKFYQDTFLHLSNN